MTIIILAVLRLQMWHPQHHRSCASCSSNWQHELLQVGMVPHSEPDEPHPARQCQCQGRPAQPAGFQPSLARPGPQASRPSRPEEWFVPPYGPLSLSLRVSGIQCGSPVRVTVGFERWDSEAPGFKFGVQCPRLQESTTSTVTQACDRPRSRLRRVFGT
jgi:hypothetical protein